MFQHVGIFSKCAVSNRLFLNKKGYLNRSDEIARDGRDRPRVPGNVENVRGRCKRRKEEEARAATSTRMAPSRRPAGEEKSVNVQEKLHPCVFSAITAAISSPLISVKGWVRESESERETAAAVAAAWHCLIGVTGGKRCAVFRVFRVFRVNDGSP